MGGFDDEFDEAAPVERDWLAEVPPHHVPHDVAHGLAGARPGPRAAPAPTGPATALRACAAVDLDGDRTYPCGLPDDGHERHRATWVRVRVATGPTGRAGGIVSTPLGDAVHEWRAPSGTG